MSLILPDNLPAIELLKQENIMVSDGMNAPKNHASALKVDILNLMPIKETTELDLLRLLSNTHLQIEVSLMKLRSHVCKQIIELKIFATDFVVTPLLLFKISNNEVRT